MRVTDLKINLIFKEFFSMKNIYAKKFVLFILGKLVLVVL